MFRRDAVKRINRGLGWLPDGNAFENDIILALQECQKDLEQGKTLPRFLVQEDQPLVLTAGTHSTALPTGFLLVDDENHLHYTRSDSNQPFFLKQRSYQEALEANIKPDNPPSSPKVYVIRNSTVDFITTADKTYNLVWNYFKGADVLTTDIENAWLNNAPLWLIGEAGFTIALDKRNASAIDLFDKMRTKGRAAAFGELLIDETAGDPIVMGSNN